MEQGNGDESVTSAATDALVVLAGLVVAHDANDKNLQVGLRRKRKAISGHHRDAPSRPCLASLARRRASRGGTRRRNLENSTVQERSGTQGDHRAPRRKRRGQMRKAAHGGGVDENGRIRLARA